MPRTNGKRTVGRQGLRGRRKGIVLDEVGQGLKNEQLSGSVHRSQRTKNEPEILCSVTMQRVCLMRRGRMAWPIETRSIGKLD